MLCLSYTLIVLQLDTCSNVGLIIPQWFLSLFVNSDFSWFCVLTKKYTLQTKFLIHVADEIIEISFALKNYQRPFYNGSFVCLSSTCLDHQVLFLFYFLFIFITVFVCLFCLFWTTTDMVLVHVGKVFSLEIFKQ